MTKHLKRPRTEHYTEPRGFFRRPPYFGEVEKTAYLIGAELEVKGGLLNKPTPEVYDQFGWPRPISPDMIKHGKPVTPKSPGRTPISTRPSCPECKMRRRPTGLNGRTLILRNALFTALKGCG